MTSSEKELIQQLSDAATELHRAGLMRPGSSAALRLSRGRLALLTTGNEVTICSMATPPAGVARLDAALLTALPDASALLHDQPVALAALGMQGVTVARCVASEPFASLAPDVTCPDDVESLAQVIADQSAGCHTITLGRYGVVVWGHSLDGAGRRLRAIDHAAQITLAARNADPLTTAPPLSERQVTSWQALANELGWAQRDQGCTDCNACGNGLLSAKASASGAGQQLIDAALDAVLER